METNINMNNNAILNLPEGTLSNHPTTKNYVDQKLNLKLDKNISHNINMNNKQITNLGYDISNGADVVNLSFCDQKYYQKTGVSDLNLNEHRVKNSLLPLDKRDLTNKQYVDDSNSNLSTQITNAYKQYVDHSHVSPSGLQRNAFRYLMEDTDDSSSENNIQVTGIVDFTASPHQINKKAYEFTLVKDTDGSTDYRSRIGFNLYSLPLGYYTFVVEYFPPEMTNVIVTTQGTTISINSQTSRTFEKYVKIMVKFHNCSKTTPDYIFINLHGKTTSSTTGYLIVYGINDYVSNVDPKV